MRVVVRGIKLYRSKGRTYCYHRATGKRIVAALGTAEFFAEVQGLNSAVRVTAARPGTLGALLAKYRASAQFSGLAARTQADYHKIMDWLKPIAAMPLTLITPPFAAGIRDKALKQKRFRFANYVTAVLSAVLSWGAEHGHVDSNPIKGHVRKAKRPKNMPARNRPWTRAELDMVLAAAPPHIRLPLALIRWTGMRTGDALAFPKTAFDGTAIQFRTGKTGQLVWMPCPAPLKAELASAPKHDAVTVCATLDGLPWTGNGFRSSVWKLIHKLETAGKVGPDLSPHGLRHSVAVDLRELGFDERTIADFLGQSEIETARLYAKGADLKKKMTAVVRKLERPRKS